MTKKKITIGNIVVYIVLLVVVFFMIYPFLWMLITAFKNEADIRSFPPVLFSGNYTLDNFNNIWNRIPFMAYYKNTLIFAGGVTACSILFDSMSGYAFARIHFRGRNILFTLVLVTLMIPFQVIMVPLYSELFHMKLLNILKL